MYVVRSCCNLLTRVTEFRTDVAADGWMTAYELSPFGKSWAS